MRRWLSLTTALVFILYVRGDVRVRRENHKQLEDCATDSVCVVFNHEDCKIKGVSTNSYIWTTKTTDCDPHYGALWARLDIQPINVTSWNITATLYSKKSHEERQTPEDFQFFFGDSNDDWKSHLSFINNNSTHFKWKIIRDDEETQKKSNQPLAEKDAVITTDSTLYFFNRKHFTLSRYSFVIHTNGEKLMDLFGPKVKLMREESNDKGRQIFPYVIDDADFLDKLNQLSNCDLSDIKEICYDTCDKIFSGSNSGSNSTNSTDSVESSTDKSKPSRVTSCPSQLWFHYPSDGGMSRKWKKINNLKCDMGWWQGNTTNGNKKIDSSMELQCSGPEPSKLTSMAKIVIGVGAGIGVLLIIGIIVVVVCFLNKKKGGGNFGGNTEKKFTIRDSDSRAQTPGGKSTEREKN